MKKTLITSALPYANGPLHFGHFAGVYLPADIYYRHKKMNGERVIHVCGSDEHGVAIMLNAEKAQMSYQEYVDQWHKSHLELFKDYNIHFDVFGRTSSDYHKEEVLDWFHRLYSNGYIEKDSEKQLYCTDEKRFLPDRYVEGTCYNCNYENARGDECPNCGEWIDPIRLKNPRSKISGSRHIEIRETVQYYLRISKMEKMFKEWFDAKNFKPIVRGFIEGLIRHQLIDRAITRDLDWGIDVPLDEAKGKKLYVWFDAPIGYVSNTKKFFQNTNEDYLKDWWANKETTIIHFIGKDNIIFHALIWPCMILGTNKIVPPSEIPASFFLNLEGKQFSKSQGWYVDSEEALKAFGEDALRFYLTSIIPDNDDTSFTWEGFKSINNELSNKIGNYISRTFTLIHKYFPQGLTLSDFENVLTNDYLKDCFTKIREFKEHLENFQFQKAFKLILSFASQINEVFHEKAPWALVKNDEKGAALILARAVFEIIIMGLLLQPITPHLSRKIFSYFPDIQEETKNLIYQGKVNEVKTLFKNGFIISQKPMPIVPRLDETLIKSFHDKMSHS